MKVKSIVSQHYTIIKNEFQVDQGSLKKARKELGGRKGHIK